MSCCGKMRQQYRGAPSPTKGEAAVAAGRQFVIHFEYIGATSLTAIGPVQPPTLPVCPPRRSAGCRPARPAGPGAHPEAAPGRGVVGRYRGAACCARSSMGEMTAVGVQQDARSLRWIVGCRRSGEGGAV